MGSQTAFASEFHLHTMPHFSPWACIPFALLLLAIAAMPFIHRHWWEEHYPKVAVTLGAVVVAYYGLFITAERGFADAGGQVDYGLYKLFHTAVEYVGFLALVGSLFVISGGIYVVIHRRASPGVNTLILGIGAVLANILGTTGASMLLIRPYLRINRARIRPFHVVFFIFVVSNTGGLLTPIGDPPLFLGYLKGVPFFWVAEHLWPIWLTVVGSLLAVFYLLDRRAQAHVATEDPSDEKLPAVRLLGSTAFVYLGGVLLLVLAQKSNWLQGLLDPLWPGHGEILLVLGASAAMILTATLAHARGDSEALLLNEFSFAPLREVGFLFLGIFATMIPALDYLSQNAASLGITSWGQFYWGSGLLSAMLDNAPTYLNFLSAAFGLAGLTIDSDMMTFIDPANTLTVGSQVVATLPYLVAISAGSVLFGAVTYIGNGPNFMVKSIADQWKVPTPDFFRYVTHYSLPILIPIYTLVWWFFIR